MSLTDNEKAAAAGRLLKDPVLIEAFDMVEQDAVDLIKTSTPEQTEEREQAYQKIKAIEAIREALDSHITQRLLNERRQPE